MRQVTNAGTPFDKVLVIVNSPDYGGSGGAIGVSYNGEWGPRIFVHEFGHSFGGLEDEYVKYLGDGERDNKTHQNCFAGIPPALEWQGLVRLEDYRLGCAYPNWYSSSQNSIMSSIEFPFFNVISQDLLRKQLAFYVNTTPPTLPNPPKDLTAKPIRPRSISLSWSDVSDNELGFLVFRSQKSTRRWRPYYVVANLSPGSRSYLDIDVLRRRKYRYFVSPYNAVGQTQSNVVLTRAP